MFTLWEDIYAYLFTFGRRHHPLGGDQSSRFCGSKFFLWILGCNTSL